MNQESFSGITIFMIMQCLGDYISAREEKETNTCKAISFEIIINWAQYLEEYIFR